MLGVARKRSKMVADEVPNLVGEDIGWVSECDVMKRWKVCDNGLLRSDMSMLKSPQARMCWLFSIIDSMLSQLLAFVAIMLMKQFGRHCQ